MLGTQMATINTSSFTGTRKNYGGEEITALYSRLSRDDEFCGDSNSIIHQKEMLGKYARDNGFRNCEYYVDDGYSGTNFNRPGFQRMMSDIESGKVKTVIVKDMSRFGRDYIWVGYYTEVYFLNNDIRFIAINDGVDTLSMPDNDFTPFKNIMNEWYAKDTSKKTKAVFRAKGLSGKHLSNSTPFGYIKDPNDRDKWIIDEEAAKVVKEIFDLYLAGKNTPTIARIMTERKIDTPQTYYLKHGRKIHKPSECPEIWNEGTIKKILAQPAYAGRTVNFRTAKKSFKNKKQIKLPKENWVTFENTQEAIVPPETFDMIQEMRKSKRCSRSLTKSICSRACCFAPIAGAI